ncbi:MAG: Thiol:disulfide interchange protein DsbD precursor, partial [Verrucomicrobiota bacterium]
IVFSIPWDGSAAFKGLLVEKAGSARKGWWIGGESKIVASGQPSTRSSGVALGVLMAALFSGFLGGLILNLMPCVLPVISLKIFNFIAQAGESPSRIFRHGLAFAAGIFAWFLGLGVLVIALKAGGSQVTWGAFQFQSPYFVVGLSALVFLFAMNLFGLFEITLPGHAATRLDQAASRGGYFGSFFQGVFATLLATPCTAPFLGSALGFAFGQSPSVILAMFASVALGMSSPYVLLSARPGWRKWIPKPGLWMEKLRQFMGFPLLATNIWLLWVLQSQRGSGALLALLALLLILGFCAWVYGSLPGTSPRVRTVVLILLAGLLAISSPLLIKKILESAPISPTSGSGEGIDWVPYSPEALESLRSQGKPVFLDFTASWCLTCQFNEKTAINLASVRSLLREKGVTAMKGDWTNSDPAITAALKSFGRVGVPLAVFYPAGKGSSPVVLPELLTEKIVLDAIRK